MVMNYEATYLEGGFRRSRRFVSSVRSRSRSEVSLKFDPVEAALEKVRVRRLSDAK